MTKEDRQLSDPIISRLDTLLRNRRKGAEQIENALTRIGDDIKYRNWMMAELLHIIHAYQLWRELSYTDESGHVKPYASLQEYMNLSPNIPFGDKFGYILLGVHAHFRVFLNLDQRAPELWPKVLQTSFDKLYAIRKVTDLDNLDDWLDQAAAASLDTLRLKVSQAELEAKTGAGDTPEVIIQPPPITRWKSQRYTKEDISNRTLYELIPDLALPENAEFEIIVRIKKFLDENGEESEE